MGRAARTLELCAAFALVACRDEAAATPATTTLTLALAVETFDAAPADDVEPPKPAPRSLAGKKVLHVGDSMVGGTLGLTRALETRLGAVDATIVRQTTVSENLISFDRTPTLRDLLRTYQPDIVILNLGANDAEVPYPQAFARNVASIARRMGEHGRECWWIGPPKWKGPDTGIVAVIRENAKPCRFYDSTPLELDRASDGIHPNERGAAAWAAAFWPVFAGATDPR